MAAPLLQAQIDIDAPVDNLNRRNRVFWPTTCTVTEVIPEKKVAFRVDINGTIWSYEPEPTDVGTRVVESGMPRTA
jgi:membrane protein implicated in regulation of membrane protease activity